jgi:hypothetical protein
MEKPNTKSSEYEAHLGKLFPRKEHSISASNEEEGDI